jgi:hypothetical protein
MLLFFVFFGLASFIYFDYVAIFHSDNIEQIFSLDDHVSQVGCNSNSMGLTLPCNTVLYSDVVHPNESLRPGRIYIYQGKNQTIVHRLVFCLDLDCNVSIFKGDNNRIGEEVNRSQVLYRVDKAEYP